MFNLVNHVLKGEYFLLTQCIFIACAICIGSFVFPNEYLVTFHTIKSVIAGMPVPSESFVSIVVSLYVTNALIYFMTNKIPFKNPGILFSILTCLAHIASFTMVIIWRYGYITAPLKDLVTYDLKNISVISIGIFITFRYVFMLLYPSRNRAWYKDGKNLIAIIFHSLIK